MGGLSFCFLPKRLETLSAIQCDCVENALSELALPNYVEHVTIIMTIMAEMQGGVFLKPSYVRHTRTLEGNTKRDILRMNGNFLC